MKQFRDRFALTFSDMFNYGRCFYDNTARTIRDTSISISISSRTTRAPFDLTIISEMESGAVKIARGGVAIGAAADL